MEVEEMIYYDHDVVQRRSQLLGSWEEDTLFIRMRLYKCNSLSRDRTGDQVYEGPKLADTAFSVEFSHFKQQLCDGNVVEYETLICKHLKNMGVQGYEHHAIVQRIFDVVEAAVSPVNAVEVIVWDITSLTGDILDEPSLIPASRSAIHGLKSVTVPNSSSQSCSVCWEHLEGKLITRLPCTHHFHVDCIVQWLQINHLCPLCRYPMPTQDSVWSSVCDILHSVHNTVWRFVQCAIDSMDNIDTLLLGFMILGCLLALNHVLFSALFTLILLVMYFAI